MTNPNYTHITLVCDRSGSMEAIKDSAEEAVNGFLTEQKAIDTACSLYLVDFDAQRGYSSNLDLLQGSWYNVKYDGPIRLAPKYDLHPRGGTALFDAIGIAVTETGKRLALIPEQGRPGTVFFVVQTDGEENSSRDWSLYRVRSLVEVQERVYSWNFVFLGMGLNTFKQGENLGFNYVFNAQQSSQGYRKSYAGVSSNIASVRTATPTTWETGTTTVSDEDED